jgi:ribosomal protein S27AE
VTSVKRKDTPESRAYWKFIEDTAHRVHHDAPDWHTCVKCGNTLGDHITRYACVLKPGVTPREDYDA